LCGGSACRTEIEEKREAASREKEEAEVRKRQLSLFPKEEK